MHIDSLRYPAAGVIEYVMLLYSESSTQQHTSYPVANKMHVRHTLTRFCPVAKNITRVTLCETSFAMSHLACDPVENQLIHNKYFIEFIKIYMYAYVCLHIR